MLYTICGECAPVAQGIEQRFPKPLVAGSIPARGTTFQISTAAGGLPVSNAAQGGIGNGAHVRATESSAADSVSAITPMADGPFKQFTRCLTAWCYSANATLTRLLWRAQGDRPYGLRGDCTLCGACCINPAIQVGRIVWHLPAARRLFVAWQRLVNGFELASSDPATRVFTFRCTHFDPATKRCDCYGSRPGMCRDYPRVLLWQAHPDFLPGCGYRPVAPNSQAFIEALEREDLSPEKLEHVKKALFLEDDPRD